MASVFYLKGSPCMKKFLSLLAIIIFCSGLVFVSSPSPSAKANNKYYKISHQLDQELTEHQSYANSDPGNYDYAKFVKSIKYVGNHKVIVYVNHGFAKMNKTDKNSIMQQVNALIKMVIQSNNQKIVDKGNRQLLIIIKNGHTKIGQSTRAISQTYKWKSVK